MQNQFRKDFLRQGQTLYSTFSYPDYDCFSSQIVRPWSVDSGHGGSADLMKIPPIKKKLGIHFLFILTSRLYLWNYWSYKNGSPIKICRILPGKQPAYFQNILFKESYSDLRKSKNFMTQNTHLVYKA